jgi:glycerol kinase
VRGQYTVDFPQIFPQPGWVEHDPEAIITSVEGAVAGALAAAGVTGEQLAAIGITNQRETTVLWDRADGRAVHNAIVWQCRRTASRCAELKAAGHEPLLQAAHRPGARPLLLGHQAGVAAR